MRHEDGMLKTLVIEDVLYVPELKKNLYSVGQEQAKGHTIVFPAGTKECLISEKNHCAREDHAAPQE